MCVCVFLEAGRKLVKKLGYYLAALIPACVGCPCLQADYKTVASSSTHFMDLGADALGLIYADLPLQDKAKLKQTCKRLHSCPSFKPGMDVSIILRIVHTPRSEILE